MALIPAGGVLAPELEAEVQAGRISAVPFALPAALIDVPLAERAAGAAQAEIAAQEVAKLLVWLDSDTLILTCRDAPEPIPTVTATPTPGT